MKTADERRMEALARLFLNIETLDVRGSDRLDFHEVGVWNLKDALLAAYKAGQDDYRRRNAKKEK